MTIPLVPVVRVGVPVTKISPPVLVPAEEDFPAFNIIASLEVDEVEIFSVILMSPARVSIKIGPVEKIPVGLTMPIVNPPLASVKLKLFNLVVLSPPAIVDILLLVLFKLTSPSKSAKLSAIIYPFVPSVTLPEPDSLTVLFPTFTTPFTAILFPYAVSGPSMVTAPIVTSLVFVDLPIVSPETSDE